MHNVSSLISGHNHKLLQKESDDGRPCICRKPDECLLNNECHRAKNVVYKGIITTVPDDTERDYVGCTDNLKPHLECPPIGC